VPSPNSARRGTGGFQSLLVPTSDVDSNQILSGRFLLLESFLFTKLGFMLVLRLQWSEEEGAESLHVTGTSVLRKAVAPGGVPGLVALEMSASGLAKANASTLGDLGSLEQAFV
jgi:hypothetical protein